jgi:Raf kinase inhibitor-like YbhB/YbcL family protein
MAKGVMLLSLVLACSCKSQSAGPSSPPGVTAASMTVTSNTFTSNGQIPVDNSCDGADRSPALTWSSPPEGTKSIAIVADDLDAPGGTFTHWIAFDLPPDARSLAEGVDPGTLGAKLGQNDFQSLGYRGPCPPKREIHRYYFHVYALDAQLAAPEGVNRDGIGAEMSGHVLGAGALVGTFSH